MQPLYLISSPNSQSGKKEFHSNLGVGLCLIAGVWDGTEIISVCVYVRYSAAVIGTGVIYGANESSEWLMGWMITLIRKRAPWSVRERHVSDWERRWKGDVWGRLLSLNHSFYCISKSGLIKLFKWRGDKKVGFFLSGSIFRFFF